MLKFFNQNKKLFTKIKNQFIQMDRLKITGEAKRRRDCINVSTHLSVFAKPVGGERFKLSHCEQ